jgi:ketosteroid isomerase-like protein
MLRPLELSLSARHSPSHVVAQTQIDALTNHRARAVKFPFYLLRLLALTIGLSILSTIAHAGDMEAEKAKLLALENGWNLAQLQRDSKALQALLSDRYVYTDYDGTLMNKGQFLSDNRDPDYKPTVVTNEEMQVIAYSNVAIVIGKYHTKGTYKDKPFDHWGRFTDTWIYENNNWQCLATHTNLITPR